MCVVVVVAKSGFYLVFHVLDTKYDKEKDLVRIRKEKEKKIEDFMEALKKKKKAESNDLTL